MPDPRALDTLSYDFVGDDGDLVVFMGDPTPTSMLRVLRKELGTYAPNARDLAQPVQVWVDISDPSYYNWVPRYPGSRPPVGDYTRAVVVELP